MRQKYKYFLVISSICLFLLSFVFAKGNGPDIPDSLQQKLTFAKSDTSRFDAMYKIAFWMVNHRTDLVEDYFPQVLSFAKKMEDPIGIAKMHNLYGNYYRFLPNYDKAFQSYYRAIAIYDSIGNSTDIGRVYNNIAGVFESTNDYQKALSFYRKSEKINLTIDNKESLSKNYNGIGIVYKEMGKYDSAIIFYQKSLECTKDPKNIMIAHSNLGVAYLWKGQYKAAEKHLKETYDLVAKFKEPHRIGIAAMNLGDLYIKMGRLDEAEMYLLEALEYSKKQAYQQEFQNCYLHLAELAEKRENPTQALAYYKTFHAISDSILNKEKNKSIREYDIKYQSQKKEQENIILREQNTINRLQIYGLGFIAFLLALFIAYFYYINQQMKNKNALITKQKDELFAANQALNALLQEKDNIIATVSHDYRSPLGRIRAVVDLVMLEKEKLSEKQQKHLQKIPIILAEATHLIDDLLDVTYIDRLTTQLHPERFEIKAELQAIVEDYQHWITQKELTIHYHFPAENCEIYTDKSAFKRIFDNLISNAIKYSHLNKNISLFIEKQEKSYSIVVKDEGQGFSAEDKSRIFSRFQRLSAQPIAVGNSYGLGLSIVKTLVEGLEATIQLEESTVGASFRIEMKHNPKA